MNTHKIWLQQLQDQYNKRMSDGNLTEDEIIRKGQTKSIHEAIREVNEPEQLDEIFPALLPLAKMAGGAVARMGAKKTIKRVVGQAAVSAVTPGQREPVEDSVEHEEDAILEEIAYAMIEELEEQIGRRLSPEEIEEFVENNYDEIQSTYQEILNENSVDAKKTVSKGKYDFEYATPISKEANNRVTANANKGDKDNGVGANAPEQPSSKPLPPLKAGKGAKGTGPKRVGSEGY